MTPTTTRRALAAASLAGGIAVAVYLLLGVGYSVHEEEAVNATPDGSVVTILPEPAQDDGEAFNGGENDWAPVLWAGFILAASAVAATSAWSGRAGPVWGAAGALIVLSVVGMASIGPVVALQAALLTVTATVVGRQRRTDRRPAPTDRRPRSG